MRPRRADNAAESDTPPPSSSSPPPEDRLINRKQIYAAYPVRRWELRRWEQEGKLPIRRRGPGRTHWYRRGDIEGLLDDEAHFVANPTGSLDVPSSPATPPVPPKVARQAPSTTMGRPRLFRDRHSVKGKLSAQAYALFEKGTSLPKVVIALERPYEEVWVLWKEYHGATELQTFLDVAKEKLAKLGLAIDSPGAALSHVEEYVTLRRARDRRVLLARLPSEEGSPPAPSPEPEAAASSSRTTARARPRLGRRHRRGPRPRRLGRQRYGGSSSGSSAKTASEA